jgi:hypothetical protein
LRFAARKIVTGKPWKLSSFVLIPRLQSGVGGPIMTLQFFRSAVNAGNA